MKSKYTVILFNNNCDIVIAQEYQERIILISTIICNHHQRKRLSKRVISEFVEKDSYQKTCNKTMGEYITTWRGKNIKIYGVD